MENLSNSLHEKKTNRCKWMFARKNDLFLQETRLVGKATLSRKTNYNEVFSLIIKHSSIQMLLTLVVQLHLELD